MPDFFVIASAEGIAELEADENPAESFPCLLAGEIHREARAQLYAIVERTFVDEAVQMEFYVRDLADDGPYIYQMENQLVTALSYFDEDDVEQLALVWGEGDLELPLEHADLAEFVFQLIHYCQAVRQGDELNLYVISDS